VHVAEGSNDWVILLIIVFDLPGDIVDDVGSFGVARGGPVSKMSLAVWELSNET